MSTAVVHLVWKPSGLAPFEAFMAAYERHPPGADHELVLLCNGFSTQQDLAPYRARAPGVRELVLDVPCLDLTAYLQAAQRLEHDHLCLVNSYSEPVADRWLALLEAALAAPGVGAAGATGSWGSHISYNLFQLGMPGSYAEAFPNRAQARQAIHDVHGAKDVSSLRYALYAAWIVARHRHGSSRFPAPHLRTNGFVIRRELLVELCGGRTATKWDTYRLESGPGSLTARLRRMGLPPVVVDRHATAFAVAEWPQADGYFQADQQDLLMTDNQTASYAAATLAQRRILSATAWGPWARPG